MLIWVDENDNVTGTGEKMETHIKGQLHRAFSVFVYDPLRDEVLLQRRAYGKYHSGGLWSNTCCSHPRAGEETKKAAEERLRFETGIDLMALKDAELRECGRFTYEAQFDGLSEHEVDHVFLLKADRDEIPLNAFNPEEINELRWITRKELEEETQEYPETFSAWFLPAYRLAEKYMGKNNMRTEWFKEAVVYQIYPFSFMDSDNDGWGDIEGIISKLDYIKDLGVTAVWFSPLYQSPDYDYGYDISDYRAIDEKFGTMADFERLLEECHKRGLKVIMDMVVNHTSTEHRWFREALSSPDSPYRDYYIIRKGRREGDKLLPPTNWESTFTGSAWERIGDTDEFYLHLFCVEQADLNWENPAVRKEIIDILNFWLEKGVDGFRFDVFNMFSKVYPFEDDHNKDSFQKGAPYYVDGPRMHEFLKEMYEKAFSLYDTFTVGESFHPSERNAREYVRAENKELDAIFSFGHLDSDNIRGKKFFRKPFDLLQFKKGLLQPQIMNYEGGWNTLVLENHDNVRSISRFSISTAKYRYEAATMLAVITFMGFGTPFIYMGEEAGLVNTPFKNMDEMKDPVSHFVHDLMVSYGIPSPLAFRFIRYGARDHARVPMAWDDSVNGGFNKGCEPWQCVNPLYRSINIKKDMESDKSVYRFYQKLIALRKENETAVYGKTEEYEKQSRQIIAYSRTWKNRKLYVIGNFSRRPASCILPNWLKGSDILINNYEEADMDGMKLRLKPYQAIVFRMRKL